MTQNGTTDGSLDDVEALERWRTVVGPALDRRRAWLGLSHDDVVNAASSSRSTWLRMRNGPSRTLDSGVEALQMPQSDTCHAYEAALRLPVGSILELLYAHMTSDELVEAPAERRHRHDPYVSASDDRAALYVRLVRALEQLDGDKLDAVVAFAELLASGRGDERPSSVGE